MRGARDNLFEWVLQEQVNCCERTYCVAIDVRLLHFLAAQVGMAAGSADDIDALIAAKKGEIDELFERGLAAGPEYQALFSAKAKSLEDDMSQLCQRREALRHTTGKYIARVYSLVCVGVYMSLRMC